MSQLETSPGHLRPRHYVVVVHGVGEQKLNHTTMPVIHRFAEVRQEKERGHFKNLLPSYLSAQSVRQGKAGHGWSEFKGIPVDPNHDTGVFDGTRPADLSGFNFRFVDLHWQHILQRHQKHYSSPTEQWARALLARTEDAKMTPEDWPPRWALPLLRSIVNVALPLKQMLAFKYSGISKLVFDDFLGDVHLYGDYARTRGRAVRHFHVILDEISLRDFIDWCRRDQERLARLAKKGEKGEPSPYEPPHFTVLAHSLGSIMSFDALVYAHADKDLREAQGSAWKSCSSLPFLGYTYPAPDEAETVSWRGITNELTKLQRDKVLEIYKSGFSKSIDEILTQTSAPEIPILCWLGHVKNFITIGSPIDKYHVMWWQQYLHMGLRKPNFTPPASWTNGVNDWFVSPMTKIDHYNFCDEQDPVGHHLDVARGTVNYKRIFNPDPVSQRDVVFRRYAKPGVAHNMYWGDKELFKGFIDKRNAGQYFLRKEFREGKKAFKQASLWAYFRIPFITAIFTAGLILYAGFGDVPIYRIGAGLGVLLLWTQPSLLAAYRDEANPEDFDDQRWRKKMKSWWIVGKLRLQKGIFARIVAGMVEWRRILLKLSEGIQTAALDPNARVAFEKGDSRGWGFWLRFLWRVGLLLMIAFYFAPKVCAIEKTFYDLFILQKWAWSELIVVAVLVLAVTHLCVLLCVAYQFVKFRHFRN